MLTTTDSEPVRRLPRILAMAIVALPLVVVLLALTTPRLVGAADCATDQVKVGIVDAQGCFSSRTPPGEAPVYETTEKFQMNGFDVEPHSGVTVTFSPADGSRRGASVTTNNGFVDLSATHPAWGPIHFNNMNFAFAPPASGELILAESALAQPYVSIVGMTPLGVKQPIRLTAEGAEFDLSFDIGGFFVNLVTHSVKQMSFGVTFEVNDGQFHVAGGKFGLKNFELANLLEIAEVAFEIDAHKIDADYDATLKGIGGSDAAFVGGATVEQVDPTTYRMTRLKLGLPVSNLELGTSGVFLQGLTADIFTAPPFGGKGSVEMTAGPKTQFFGREVTAVKADGSIELRGADVQANRSGFFKVDAEFALVSLPVGNADFAYHFGQGTEFGINFGIGFPSARNDPGQPTYLGGRFNGWTTAHHFDLEGRARLKVIGIDLLGAQAVVSDIGFAGCLQVGVWVGGGMRWADGHGEFLGGSTCNIGKYRPARSAATQMAATGSTHMNLAPGHRVVRLTPPDGEEAPQVTLTHPDGRTLKTPEPGDEDGIERSKHGAALRALDGTSAFVIRGDAGGAWRLDRVAGSSEVETIEIARELPPHRVRARITGRGRQRTLHWRARKIPHQRLHFLERLPNGREIPILITRKASGKHRFRPVEGLGTYGVTRRLAVDVRQRMNTPRDELIAHRYVVRRQPAPKRIRNLRVHRRLQDLVVRWKRSRRAASYRVVARAGGEATYVKEVSGKRRYARLPIGTTRTMRIRVTPLNAQGRRGKPGRRVIDTERLVPSRRAAVRRMVRGTWVTRRGRVVAHPACPDGGHCEITLRVRLGKRTLGTGRLSLPPDMTDRLAVELSPRARAKLRRARPGAIRLRGTIEQLDGSATYRSSL